MKRLNLLISALCSIGIVWSANGTTLFNDSFTDTSNTEKAKWTNYASQLTVTWAIGSLTLKNTDATYTGFMIRPLPPTAKPKTYTLTASFQVTDGSSGMGLMHCLNTTTGMTGYTLQFAPSKNVYAYSGSTLLMNQDAGFGNATTFTICVSKSSTGEFDIFCNGNYVTKYNSTQYDSGDIAILVPPSSTIKITNIQMTNQFTQGNAPTVFADTFLSAGLKTGWTLSALQGTVTSGGGSCVLNNTTASPSMIYTVGNFTNASMRTVVTQKNGAGLYGATFVSINSSGTSVSYKNFSFTVDSARYFSIIYPDSQYVRSSIGYGILGSYGVDTIDVLKFANKYVLKINGNVVQDNIPIPLTYRIDAAGVYTGSNTSATFNLFVVGGDSTGATTGIIRNVNYRPSYNSVYVQPFGKGSIVYDIMGRKVGSFDKVGFEKANLMAGTYFVWTPGMNGAKGLATKVMKIRNK